MSLLIPTKYELLLLCGLSLYQSHNNWQMIGAYHIFAELTKEKDE